jgi:hypothetical protein
MQKFAVAVSSTVPLRSLPIPRLCLHLPADVVPYLVVFLPLVIEVGRLQDLGSVLPANLR